MFGINSFEQVGQIVEGHWKELTNQENDLFATRIKICKECPLYTETTIGPICDAKKCYNTKTNTKVSLPGDGTVCGCGCRLASKTRIRSASCVLSKW